VRGGDLLRIEVGFGDEVHLAELVFFAEDFLERVQGHEGAPTPAKGDFREDTPTLSLRGLWRRRMSSTSSPSFRAY